jgi:hypothetical protein
MLIVTAGVPALDGFPTSVSITLQTPVPFKRFKASHESEIGAEN